MDLAGNPFLGPPVCNPCEVRSDVAAFAPETMTVDTTFGTEKSGALAGAGRDQKGCPQGP